MWEPVVCASECVRFENRKIKFCSGEGEVESLKVLREAMLTLSRALFFSGSGWSVAPGILGTRRGQEKQV